MPGSSHCPGPPKPPGMRRSTPGRPSKPPRPCNRVKIGPGSSGLRIRPALSLSRRWASRNARRSYGTGGVFPLQPNELFEFCNEQTNKNVGG
eukprot:scaffold16628_cov48-Prasinocladus_malaysianus.AAC.4